MAGGANRRNSGNQDYTNNADGFTLAGGTTQRAFSVSGSDVIIAGTGSTTYTFPSSTYPTLVGKDANGNVPANNFLQDYTTTATAAGTTTLTVASTRYQYFTGTTTQTVVLPDATTLAVGHTFHIKNDSTGAVTVQTNGGATLVVLPGGTDVELTCTNVGTSAGTWGNIYIGTQGIVPSEQFISLTANYTLTSATTLQKIFNTPTNGTLTVNGASTYFFECFLYITSMNATGGNLGFSIVGAGTATFTSAAWFAHGLDATTQTTAAAIGGMSAITSAATGNIVTSGTGTALHVFIKGIFRINAGGTIIPSIQLTTANAAIVNTNSFFTCKKVGTNTTTFVGSWT